MMTSYSCFQFFRLVSSCFSRNKQRQVPQKTPQLFQSNGPVRPGQWNTCAFTLRFYLQQRQNLPEINKKCRGSMPQAVSLLQGKRKRAFQLNSLEHSFLSYGDTILTLLLYLSVKQIIKAEALNVYFQKHQNYDFWIYTQV